MALRFRRGSESDRTNPSFVPEDGEPVWIVDTKRLYIGDGSTSGGILVTGASGGGSTPGINDTTTGVVLTLDNATSTFTNDVELDSSDLILAGGSITGTGNINILGNITASGTLTSNIANIGSINATATVTAPFFVGDHLGSVFAEDSTLIVDVTNRKLIGDLETFSIIAANDIITINNGGSTAEVGLEVDSLDARSIISLIRNSESDLTGNASLEYGSILFGRNDSNGPLTTSLIISTEDTLFFGNNPLGSFATANFYFVWRDNKFGIGNLNPSVELDVVGDAIISGSLTAGAILLSGNNIDTDDSSPITVTPAVTFNSDVVVENSLTVTNTLTVDTLAVTNFQTAGAGTPELSSDTDILLTAGTRVEITSSPIKMASFTTAERDGLSAQNGDMIYNSSTNKFQGYENGAWVNLV